MLQPHIVHRIVTLAELGESIREIARVISSEVGYSVSHQRVSNALKKSNRSKKEYQPRTVEKDDWKEVKEFVREHYRRDKGATPTAVESAVEDRFGLIVSNFFSISVV